MILLNLLLSLSLQFSWANVNFQNGDIIFQKSQSRQSKAIYEATESEWTHMGVLYWYKNKWHVYEAIQPVSITTLKRFQERSKNGHIVVKRIHPNVIDLSQKKHQVRLKQELLKFNGLDYDLLFEWSDDRIYCSELIWKGIYNSYKISIGKVQRFKDLKLNGPYVKKLIKERLDQTGKELDLNGLIITPISMMNSAHLINIYDSKYKSQK